jgi:hypothetical protein
MLSVKFKLGVMSMKSFCFLILALLAWTAAFAQQSAKSTLYIVNDSRGGGLGLRPLTLKVLDGEQEVASVKNHQIVKLDIAEGAHSFALKSSSKGRVLLTMKAGETYFLRVSMDQGFTNAGARCVLMKPEEAVHWIPQAKQFVSESETPESVVPVSTQPAPLPTQVVVSSDPSESLGNRARIAREHQACLEAATENPKTICT